MYWNYKEKEIFKMDLTQAYEDIKSYLLEAGSHALEIQKDIKRQYKAGEQAVTQADLDNSKLAAKRLAHWLEQEDHVLIDEESIDQVGTPEDVFANTRYQWVLDPIDGTAGYALGRDRWAVSLGLLENGKPIGGGFYMPALGKLLLVEADGKATITDINTGKKGLVPMAEPMDINSQVFVDSFFGFNHCWVGEKMEHNKVWLNTPECAVQGGYSTFMHQAAGTSFIELYSIWDAAGLSAIAAATGHKIMSLDNDKELEFWRADLVKEDWKLENKWIMAHPDNYDAIKKALTGQ